MLTIASTKNIFLVFVSIDLFIIFILAAWKVHFLTKIESTLGDFEVVCNVLLVIRIMGLGEREKLFLVWVWLLLIPWCVGVLSISNTLPYF